MSALPSPLRCAVRADLRGDPMLGTAFPANRLLLVEERFPWGTEGLRTSRFDRQTALELEARGRELGVRVQAIRRVGRAEADLPRRWAFVDTRRASRAVRWGEFEADRDLADLTLDGTAPGAVESTEPIYLVCTHGKHDACCAQRGRPVASALVRLAPGRVWQASHLGGCRFSATVLVLPTGIMYGRMTPSGAAGLVAATESGQLMGVSLRGQIGLSPATQAAVGYAHQHLGLTGVDDVVVRAAERLDGTQVRVTVSTPAGDWRVTVQGERIDTVGLTCASPGATWFLAHRLTDIVSVDADRADHAGGAVRR